MADQNQEKQQKSGLLMDTDSLGISSEIASPMNFKSQMLSKDKDQTSLSETTRPLGLRASS